MDSSGEPRADAVCEGGDLDCGSGLLLIIRQAMHPLLRGGVLEVRSREPSVRVDLPAWCRLVGHELLLVREALDGSTRYSIQKRGAQDEALVQDRAQAQHHSWSVRARCREPMKARVYVRNHAMTIGQPASFDTEDEAPSAIECLLASLASCLAVGLRWRASRRGIEVRELEVSLRAQADNVLVFLGMEDAGHPGLFKVEGRVFVDAEAQETVLRELWEETLVRSPVAQSLARPIPIAIELRAH